MASKILKYVPGVILICFFIFWTFLFSYSSPDEIISAVGIENAYFLIFALALIGGFTTFSGVPYHFVLIALAVGGLSPWLLGLVAAFGVMIGDSTSYLLGYYGRFLAPDRLQATLKKLSRTSEKYPRLLPLFFFIYGSLWPASNDIITIPMGILHYPFLLVMAPLGLGNLVFNTSLAFFANYIYVFLYG